MSDQGYERGSVEPGQADQLPYGAATQANEAAAQAPPPEPAPTVEETPTPVEAPVPEDQTAPVAQEEEAFAPGAGSTGLNPEDEKYLFSPTEHPDQAPTPMRMINPSDPEVAGWLPDLAAEAARPDAPPQLKAIFKSIVLGPAG